MTLRTKVCNVLVVGSGGAGLRAAIAVDMAGADVIVVGKRLKKDAHTVLAAGGINAALGTRDPEDSWQQHFADTMKEGYYLADPDTVELLVREAPAAVLELDDWGCEFARTEDGRIDQRYFGAHKYRRTAYAGDYTGRAIIETLAAKADERRIPIQEHQYVSRLLVADGRCFGALAFDIYSGERTVYLADAVILAAGGHTRLWRRSSSRRDENTGDGMWLALTAGAQLADMELVQFHPTGMVHPETWAGTLVTEAVRGEGGHLLNASGERYMQRYDPDRMELSTRDRVALANYTEIAEGRGTPNGGVYLDISHRGKDFILEKLPRMYRQFLEAQMLDISETPMEVAPTAHYSMGGVIVDPETHATNVEGLYAAGEVTSGVHGANRLGGNSLAEVLVFGRRAGEAAAAYSGQIRMALRAPDVIEAAVADLDSFVKEGDELTRPLQRAVRNTMWEHCGVVRSEENLTAGLERLHTIRERAAAVDVRPTSEGWQDLAIALDLRSTLLAAEATLRGALARRETRGAHFRADYPDKDPAMRVNFVLSLNETGELQIERQPTSPVREDLRTWLDDAEYTVAGRLLE
ncbi:MAG: FAD-binding protein [Chloroflexi bacterium]|nr:FAD-binding protein [Chloroflexota bacterium]